MTRTNNKAEWRKISIFGPKRDEVTREWRKLHNEEFNDVNSSPNIVRVIKSKRKSWAGHEARMVRWEACAGFYGEAWRKRPLGRSRHRWDDNIKMDFQEGGCGVIAWNEQNQDRGSWRPFVNAVMNIRVIQNGGISWPAEHRLASELLGCMN